MTTYKKNRDYNYIMSFVYLLRDHYPRTKRKVEHTVNKWTPVAAYLPKGRLRVLQFICIGLYENHLKIILT